MLHKNSYVWCIAFETVVSRWLVLVLAVFYEICMGSVYAVGLYSDDLKNNASRGYSQTELNYIFLSSNIGFHLPNAGWIYDW